MLNTITKILKKFVGDKQQNDLKAVKPLVDKILALESTVQSLSDDGLRQSSNQLKEDIRQHLSAIQSKMDDLNRQGESLPAEELEQKEVLYSQVDQLKKELLAALEEKLIEILPMAFAIVKETSRRWSTAGKLVVTATEFDQNLAAQGKAYVEIQGNQATWLNEWDAAGSTISWNMVHYDVQLIGGIALHQGKVSEMATGEGKTLVATLPVFLNALAGRGVHVVTVNDYLSRRDSEWMGPLYEFHGLTVDCIDKHQPNSAARRKAYQADITFGTNNEFGFDYLRDNMASEAQQLVQREHHFAIVDEVDSVLIDEARTPLIISGPTPKGDQQEFDQLKPRVQTLVNAQKNAVTEFITQAKKKIQTPGVSKDELQEGALALLRAYRGLPKNKALIKFLSEEGIKALLLKVEGTYLQDNQREMPKVDAELFFVIDEKNNSIELTEKGIQLMSNNMSDDNFFVLPDLGTEMAIIEQSSQQDEERTSRMEALQREYTEKSDRIHTIQQLLKAYALFEKDVDYVVMENKVKIVDEQTGRIMEGRRYSDGLHQAIEAKENVRVEAATQTYATITLQNYFRMYHKLAGMTGTAETEAGELWSIYKLDVMVIPTHRSIVRQDHHDKVYKTKREKYNAIIDEVVQLREKGRPVLVGTTTVEVSELLSRMLRQRNIDHQVLNAKLHQREADIVALAGQAGTVTIATNMAGRGTDIKLGSGVKDAGGLAIVGTERHDSRRVDRQLRGRSGRQGDPGSSQFYVSLEDDLMRLFGSDRISKMMDKMGHQEGDVIQHGMITSSIERAQKKVEENHFGVRKRLLEFDDVMNTQREVIYKRRKHALFGDRLKLDIDNMLYDMSNNVVLSHVVAKNYTLFKMDCIKYFGLDTSIQEDDLMRGNESELTQKLYEEAYHGYSHRMTGIVNQALPVIANISSNNTQGYQNIAIPLTDGRKHLQMGVNMNKALETQGAEITITIEKSITLAIIDMYWKEHLRAMDDLRHNVHFASHEQKDPLLIYKLESYDLFKNMLAKMNGEIVQFLMTCRIEDNTPAQVQSNRPAPSAPKTIETKAESQNLAERSSPTHRPSAGPEPVKVEPVRADPKVGRNDPCPCGSGKKYKSCHGAI